MYYESHWMLLHYITERYLPLEDSLKNVMERELEVIIMEERWVATNIVNMF